MRDKDQLGLESGRDINFSHNDTSELVTEDYYVSVQKMQLLWLHNAICRTIIAPFDRVKFILQCQHELQRIGALKMTFRGAGHCVQHLTAIEGRYSFWRGNLIQVVSFMPNTMAQLFIALPTQSFVFDACSRNSVVSSTVASYMAVIAGSLAAATVSYPLEYARFRIAVDLKPSSTAPYEYRNCMTFFSHPILNDSPHLYYKGLGLYLLGSMLYYFVHHRLLDVFGLFVPPETSERRYSAIAVQVGAGLSVSALSTLCLYPLDTVRRRMMIAAMEEDLRYQSSIHCLRRILLTEGFSGLYSGARFSLIRMLVTTGVLALSGGFA